MAERQQAEYWTDFGNAGSSRLIKDRAQWHETRRQQTFVSILLELHLMAASGLISKSSKSFQLLKSRWQDDFGADESEMQIVYCIPRQLVINAKAPQEILRIPLPDRSDFIRKCFGRSDVLPTSFNETDSLCEYFGLIDGFRAAFQAAISSGHISEGNLKFEQVAIDIKVAFDLYKSKSKDVFMSGSSHLQKKLVFPKPLPENERKWKQQLLITENYAHALRYSNVVNTVIELKTVEGLINIYNKLSN